MTSSSGKETKRKYATTAFPKNTLKEALKLAESIQNNNAGKPYSRIDLAKSLDYTPESSLFRTLITSSGRFGLTSGGYQADRIALEPIGVQIVAPRDDAEKADGIKKALFSIKLYSDFFTKFNGHKVPKKEFFKASLNRDYGIPNEDTDECYDMIIKNAKELGIINTIKDGEYFQLELLMPKGVPSKPPEGEGEPEHEESTQKPSETTPETPSPRQKPKVFISHSKNQKILAQIERILSFGQFEYVIAQKSETTAIPIPDKIFGDMRSARAHKYKTRESTDEALVRLWLTKNR
jgi:hypothetical protein